jgi:hypothetical protein
MTPEEILAYLKESRNSQKEPLNSPPGRPLSPLHKDHPVLKQALALLGWKLHAPYGVWNYWHCWNTETGGIIRYSLEGLITALEKKITSVGD